MSASCTLYWAPSTIPNAGNGCFTAVDLANDAYLPSLDTIVPVFETCPFVDLKTLLGLFPAAADEGDEDEDEKEETELDDHYDYDYGEDDYGYSYSHIKHMITDCYPPRDGATNWAWSDYSWNGSNSESGRWMELVKDMTDVDVHSMGIGALCNALPGASGLSQDEIEEEDEGESARVGPGAGAFFSDRGSTKYYTDPSSNLAAGSELFLDYGASYYERRGYGGADDTNVAGRRSLEYLEQHGKCLDNVLPGPSHIGPHAGQGAISSRFIQSDSVIAPLPVIYIIDDEAGSAFDLYEVTVDVGIKDDEHQTNILSAVPMGKQVMLNYVLGHPDSSLILSPYGPFYYNHASAPNARLRWARDELGHRAELLDLSVEELASVRGRKSGLALEVIALRDIAKNEEVTLDYGREWAMAWAEHVEKWNRMEGTAYEEEKRHVVFHPHAFRHKVLVPDDIYPEPWRNLKRQGEAGAGDEF